MYAYFDIGGTKTRIAVSEDGTTLAQDPVKIDTPTDFAQGVERIVQAVQQLAGATPIQALAGGIAGPINADRTALANSSNLPDWVNKPLTETLSDRLNAPVYLENDSGVVALGEAHYGAGKGAAIMAYLTISTGVGGARIVHGSIDRTTRGFEPGHHYIDFDHTACSACVSGTMENYLSGTATERRFGVKPYEVSDPAVWEQLARWLAYAVNNTIVFWSPDVVVLGGSMIVGDPAISVERTREHLHEVCTVFPELPDVRAASLNDMGGIYGAMALLSQQSR